MADILEIRGEIDKVRIDRIDFARNTLAAVAGADEAEKRALASAFDTLKAASRDLKNICVKIRTAVREDQDCWPRPDWLNGEEIGRHIHYLECTRGNTGWTPDAQRTLDDVVRFLRDAQAGVR